MESGWQGAARELQRAKRMVFTRGLVVALSAMAVVTVASCSDDEGRPKAPGSGGSGGAGATGGESASGGMAGIASGGSAGSGGGVGGSGAAPPTDGALDEPCTSNVAFWATGAAFLFPTPQGLAHELSALTYDYEAHPLTVVLAAKPSGEGFLSIGATEGDGVPQAFPSGKKPTAVAATIAAGGFSTATTQLEAWLRVVDQSGPKDILLENLSLAATTSNKCSTLSAIVTATIPESQLSLVLDLPGGAKSIQELAGGAASPDGGAGYPLKMVFSGEATDFDFGSL